MILVALKKRAADNLKALPTKTRTLPAHGGDRKTDQDDKIENVRLISGYGNSSTYRLGKIKRDHPQLAERIMAGEFKSVSEAERAAGLSAGLF